MSPSFLSYLINFRRLSSSINIFFGKTCRLGWMRSSSFPTRRLQKTNEAHRKAARKMTLKKWGNCIARIVARGNDSGQSLTKSEWRYLSLSLLTYVEATAATRGELKKFQAVCRLGVYVLKIYNGLRVSRKIFRLCSNRLNVLAHSIKSDLALKRRHRSSTKALVTPTLSALAERTKELKIKVEDETVKFAVRPYG